MSTSLVASALLWPAVRGIRQVAATPFPLLAVAQLIPRVVFIPRYQEAYKTLPVVTAPVWAAAAATRQAAATHLWVTAIPTMRAALIRQLVEVCRVPPVV